MTSVSGSDGSNCRGGGGGADRSWRGRLGGGGGSGGSGSGAACWPEISAGTDPVILAIRSATATPSVWLPVGGSAFGSGPALRSHGAAACEGRGLRVSH